MTDNFEKVRNKIHSISSLSILVQEWKAKGMKIVFTNGCFDLVHFGHVSYLSKAGMLGQKLIVGLNSDISVKCIKGEKRPYNDQVTRSFLLASMFYVDAVVIFDDVTPLKIINLIMPNILVKGGDYKIEEIVGYEEVINNGGEVLVIDTVEGYSSSQIINKL